MVVAGLVVVAAIALLLLTESTMEADRAARGIESLQADYTALAAIEHAAWTANQDACASYDLPTTAFGTHSYAASFSPTSGSPTTIDATTTLASGISRALSRSATRVYQPPHTPILLQPDAGAGADGYVSELRPNWNYGVSTTIWVEDRYASSRANGLLRFDLGAIPFGARIYSAVLELYQTNVSLAGGPISVHRATRSWVEGAQSGNAGSGASWDEAESGVAWTSGGGDFEVTPYATTPVPGGVSAWVAWDIAALTQGWVSGAYPNHGLVLRADSSGTAAHLASSDSTTPSERPKLTIEYSCECGVSCTVPLGSGAVLMLVRNALAPTPGDLAKSSVIEALGYTVTLHDDNASAGSLVSEMASHDVLYVAQGVDPTVVAPKLTGLAAGVVSEVGELNDEIGIAGGAAWTTGDTLTIADNAHYITEPFELGDLRVYEAAMEGTMVAGTQSPALVSLGEWGGTPGLAALETGSPTASGGTAAGRRALLPIGRNIDLRYLNNNGRLIMQRTLAWAAGASGGSGQSVLLVVPNAASLGPQDSVKRTLIESWGLTVALISANATQGQFDAAVAASDVAYVSEEVTTSELGTKLRDATIGVVIEEQAITDEFGISSGNTTFTEGSINVTDNTHYITSPFSLGAVAFASSPQAVGAATGTLAPGLEVLALRPSSSTGMLDVIDTGGALYDSGTAAGRRVKLPWGGNDFDINSLTADGRTIMRRAIEWGAGAGDAGPPPPPSGYFDQFNSRTCDAAQDYAGSDGTLDWSPWLWAEINESDGSCAGRIQIESDPLVPDPGSYRMAINLNSRRTQRMVDLSGFTAPLLTFDFRLDSYPDTDFFRLRISDNGGISWIELDRFTGPLHQTDYQSASYDVSAFIATNTILSFEFNGLSTSSAAYFDNVRIYDTAGGGGTPPATFLDQFNAIAYDGSDGTLDWTPNVWVEDDSNGGGASSGFIHVAGGRLSFDPKQEGDNIYREADLSSATTATLTLDVDNQLAVDDVVRLEVYDGSGWTFLKDYTSANTGVYSDSFDITGQIASNTRVRFWALSGDEEIPMFFDNVRIAIDGEGGGGGGDGGGTCDGTFRDEFNARSFSGSDGTLAWAGDWVEVGESDGADSGDTRVTDDLSDFQLRTQDNDNGGEGVEREADLSGASSATLSYDYRREGLDSSSDYTSVAISANGAAGPWTELTRHEGSGDDNNYVPASHNIASFISSSTRIRFVTSSNMGSGDAVWFDNVEIACSP